MAPGTEPSTTQTRERTLSSAQKRQRAVRPLDESVCKWPNLSAIREAQAQHAEARPSQVTGDMENEWLLDGKLWIPKSCESLIPRLIVVAHCGPQGHRGREATVESLNHFVYVDHLRARVDRFLASCLLCHHVKGGKLIPWPWSELYRCNERNGALHWDYLSLSDTFSRSKYLLVLMDDATHFCELIPCATPTSMVAADALLTWHSRYGTRSVWISDQGSHFKNELIKGICKRMKARQEFTVAYSLG